MNIAPTQRAIALVVNATREIQGEPAQGLQPKELSSSSHPLEDEAAPPSGVPIPTIRLEPYPLCLLPQTHYPEEAQKDVSLAHLRACSVTAQDVSYPRFVYNKTGSLLYLPCCSAGGRSCATVIPAHEKRLFLEELPVRDSHQNQSRLTYTPFAQVRQE